MKEEKKDDEEEGREGGEGVEEKEVEPVAIRARNPAASSVDMRK